MHVEWPLPEGEFLKRYAMPFLYLEHGDEEQAEFHTVAVQEHMLDKPALSNVVPLIKTNEANPFSFVTIGRSRNNDVVIRSNAVSKCHAAFQQQGETYTVMDMGSKNGTRLNGEALKPRTPYPVKDGDYIDLAPGVYVMLLSPQRAFTFLKEGKL